MRFNQWESWDKQEGRRSFYCTPKHFSDNSWFASALRVDKDAVAPIWSRTHTVQFTLHRFPKCFLYYKKWRLCWQLLSSFRHISYISLPHAEIISLNFTSTDSSDWRLQEVYERWCRAGYQDLISIKCCSTQAEERQQREERDLKISSSKPLCCSIFQRLLVKNERKLKGSEWLLL